MNQDDTQVNPAKLFVGNLSYNVTTDQLREKFAEVGTVVDAIVMSDKFSGRSKGFGFVTMSTAEEAQKAVDTLAGQKLDDRELVVNIARPRAPREDRGGFNRGGGAGGYQSHGRDNNSRGRQW